MNAVQCVTKILKACKCEVLMYDESHVIFKAVSMKPRICAIVTDGIAHARFLTVLPSNLRDEDTLCHLRSHIENAKQDTEFIGHLDSDKDEVYWRIDFTLCSNEESNQEMLDAVFAYAYDDLSRLDVILALLSTSLSSAGVRKLVADVGFVHGSA